MNAAIAKFQARKKPTGSQISLLRPAHSSLLQRRCVCGGSPGLDGECEECQANKLMPRRAGDTPLFTERQPVTHKMQRTSCAALDSAAQALMQPPGHSAGLITGTAFDFAKAAISANGIQLRRRLKIGRTDDPAEAEADHAAEKVVRMPEPVQSRKGIAQKVTGRFQTSGHKEAQALQMERSETYADARQEAPSIIHEVLRSTGQPLGASTRHFMEPRFGHDFSQVRVHTDARAAESPARWARTRTR